WRSRPPPPPPAPPTPPPNPPPPHQPGAGDEALQLLEGEPARKLEEAAVGRQPELLRRDVRQEQTDPLGDVLGALDVERLDVDDAGRELALVAVPAPELGLLHLAVADLEGELVAFRVEDGREHPAVVALAARPAAEVAEADVQADLRRHVRDAGVEQVDPAGLRARDDRVGRLVDLYEVGA